MIDFQEIAKAALKEAKQQHGVCALAKRLGISHAAVSKWEIVPADRVVDVSRLTGVSRKKLRPDLFHEYDHVA